MSQRVHTHYDNLKVERDAPFEVIDAAYRSLLRKYQGRTDPDGLRLLELLAKAHAVLSDPAARREHDRWIRDRESEREEFFEVDETRPAQDQKPPRESSPATQAAVAPSSEANRLTCSRGLFFACIVILSLSQLFKSAESSGYDVFWLVIAHLVAGAFRYSDAGYSPWRVLRALIPGVNFYVLYELLALPTGYAVTRKPDKTKMVVAWLFSVAAVVVGIFILVMVIVENSRTR